MILGAIYADGNHDSDRKWWIFPPMKYTLFHCGYNKDHLKHEKTYLDNK